jgi:tetratricopeptide (TPR) repeat protein
LPNGRTDLYGSAEALAASGQADEAIAWFQKELALDPENANALCSLGKIYLLKKNEPAALNTWRKVIARNPAFVPAYELIEDVYKRKNDTDGLLAEWRKMAVAYPNAVAPNFLLGRSLKEKNDHCCPNVFESGFIRH